MKKLIFGVSLALVFTLAAVCGPNTAIADDAATTVPVTNFDENIIATGRAVGLERTSITVPLADINLNNEQGVLVLYRRLQQASETVCGMRMARVTKCLKAQQLSKDCYQQSLSNAVKTVNSENLTKLHRG